jgi:hypothetical protein
MHNCPDCDRACYCDGEDHYNRFAEQDCTHVCAPDDEDDESHHDSDAEDTHNLLAADSEGDRDGK